MKNVHAIAPFMPSYYNMNDFREVNTKGKIKGGGEGGRQPLHLPNLSMMIGERDRKENS